MLEFSSRNGIIIFKHIKVIYILGLVFGVFGGVITAAFSFMLSLNSPVRQVV